LASPELWQAAGTEGERESGVGYWTECQEVACVEQCEHLRSDEIETFDLSHTCCHQQIDIIARQRQVGNIKPQSFLMRLSRDSEQ